MKKIILLSLTVLLIASIANAQITKGSTYLGGQISGYTTKSMIGGATTQKEHSLFISPAIGTAIQQNLIAGIDFTYGHSSSDVGITKGNTYGADFFLRSYFSIANRFNFFVQERAGYSYVKLETYAYSNTSNVASLSLYPGVSFRLSRILYIEAGLNNLVLLSYSHSTNIQPNAPDQTSNNFNFSTSASGTNLSFALRFIIPKK